MATKIIHKKSSTTGSVPSAGSLEPGELALNLADQKLYSKKTDGTVVEMSPVAAQPTAMQTKTEFTATAGQTTFTVAYTPNAVNVYRNGIRLQSSDFTATTGTTIVLDNACTVGDTLEVEAFTVSGIVAKSTVLSEVKFTATQGQTSFSLTYDVGGVFVFLNGIKLQDSDYTASSGSAIVLASGANAGDILDIQKFVVQSVHAQAAVLSELEFTATANQTTFTANYTAGAIEVFLNGVRLQAADYTATNGTSIVLATGATVGDILSVQKFTVSSLYTLPTSSYTETEFTAVAGQTNFTHSYDVGGVTVYLNGVKLQASDYAATSGSSIVLTAGATVGDILTVQKFTVAAVNAQLAVRTAQEFTATANQTTFNFTYTAGAIDVYLNGIKLPDSDFTASNGSTVVLDTGTQAGSVLEIVKYTVGSLDAAAAVITNAAFTATASQTTFTTTYTPNQVEVFVNGLKLPDADYTASNGSSIVLATGAQAGDSVEIQKYAISDINSVSIDGDTSPTLGGNLDTNNKSITSASNNNVDLDPNGSGAVVFKGNSTKGAGQFKLNCEVNTHGVTIKGPPHSAGASYTLTLPNNDGDASQVLTSNGSGVTSWSTPAGGATVFIASSGELSSAASASFTAFDSSKYDNYVFYLNHVKPATDNQLLFAYASVNGGSSYDTTNGNYHLNANTDTTGFNIHHQVPAGNDTNEYGISGQFRIIKPHASAYTVSQSEVGVFHTNGYYYPGAGGDYINSFFINTNEVNAIQFKFGSGNITSGEIVMCGIRNS